LAVLGSVTLKSGSVNEALEYCSLGLEYANELGSVEDQRECAKCLSEAWELKGNTKKALKYSKLFIELNSLLVNEERYNEISFL